MELELRPPKRKRRTGLKSASPYPIHVESNTGIPAHLSIWQTYSGYFNGDGVEVESPADMSALFNMGFFGKGLLSRGCPLPARKNQFPEILRERQWVKRSQWATQQDHATNEEKVVRKIGSVEEKSVATTEQTKMDIQIEEIKEESGEKVVEEISKEKERCGEVVEEIEKEMCQKDLNETLEREIDELEKIPCKKGERGIEKELSDGGVAEIEEESCEKDESSEVEVLKCGNVESEPSNIEVVDIMSSDEDGVVSQSSDQNKKNPARRTSQSTAVPREVIILADTDSEDDDYLSKLKPRLEADVNKKREVLLLSMEEAMFLSYGLGCLKVLSLTQDRTLDIIQLWTLSQECDSRFVERYVAFHHYRSRGWVVKSGLKFGGDYLLYKEGPGIYHASYIVVVDVVFVDDVGSEANTKRDITWTNLMGLNRLAESSGKEVLLCQVVWPKNVPRKNLPSPNIIKRFTVFEFLIRRWQSTVARIDHSDSDAVTG